MDKFIKEYEKGLNEDFCKFSREQLTTESKRLELYSENYSTGLSYILEYSEELLLQKVVEYHKQFPILHANFNFYSEIELIRNAQFRFRILKNPILQALSPNSSSDWMGMGGSQGVLSFFFFLNDSDGGIDFLHSSDSMKAELGKIVIAPFSFTHTYKVRPPVEGEMFLISGIIENSWGSIPPEL